LDFYYDIEGNGQPRLLTIQFTLSQPKPGGGVYEFVIQSPPMLYPLYDVTIYNDGYFTLLSDCALVGDNSITLEWLWPNGTDHKVAFKASKGKPVPIGSIYWELGEVGALANLRYPVFQFFDTDTLQAGEFSGGAHLAPSFQQFQASQVVNLVPIDTSHVTNIVSFPASYPYSSVTKGLVSSRYPEATGVKCTAQITYSIWYKLRFYEEFSQF